MTLAEILEKQKKAWGRDFVKNKRNLEDLLCFYLKKSWGQLQLSSKEEVSSENIKTIDSAFLRYRQGTPVAHITGEKFFFKSDFNVDSNVLIPRPETEILVEKSLELINKNRKTVFDFGAGSGCIGLSIAKEVPQAQVHLFEKSPPALEMCRKNSKKLDVKNVEFHLTDLCNSPNTRIPFEPADLIVANPPYIKIGDPKVENSVHNYEPHMALYCDENGLEIPKIWIQTSYQLLKPGGFYLFEFGKDQEIPLTDFIATTDYSIIEMIPDYAGIDRFLKLKKE